MGKGRLARGSKNNADREEEAEGNNPTVLRHGTCPR